MKHDDTPFHAMSEDRRERRAHARQINAKAPVPATPVAWRKTLIIGFAAMLAGVLITLGISQRFYRGLVPPSQQRMTTFHAGLTLGQLQEMTPAQLDEVGCLAQCFQAGMFPIQTAITVRQRMSRLRADQQHAF